MFEVGDILIGLPHNGYGVTNNETMVKVKAIDGKAMVVSVIQGPHKGENFMVSQSAFTYYSTPCISLDIESFIN